MINTPVSCCCSDDDDHGGRLHGPLLAQVGRGHPSTADNAAQGLHSHLIRADVQVSPSASYKCYSNYYWIGVKYTCGSNANM